MERGIVLWIKIFIILTQIKNGKLVNGSASLNHYIHTVKGSVQEYNNEIGAAYIAEFVKIHSDAINAGLAKKAQKDNFKVI